MHLVFHICGFLHVAALVLALVVIKKFCTYFCRKNLCQMIHDLLVHMEIQESLVDVLHDRYVGVQPEESSRIQELVEIIADVQQPIVMIETPQNKEEKRVWELKVMVHPTGLLGQYI